MIDWLVAAPLQVKDMWQDTILVFSSDNGGPSWLGKACNASNYPLRGGKASAWEGGHRVAAFVSGGLVPSAILPFPSFDYRMHETKHGLYHFDFPRGKRSSIVFWPCRGPYSPIPLHQAETGLT